MRVSAAIAVFAIASGVVARPMPNPEAKPEPQIWSLKCGLFGWRCPNNNNNVEPQPTTQAPPNPPTTTQPQPTTSQGPPPTPSGCLTPDFCPDTSGGQGGNPPDGQGTGDYPNGTKPPDGVRPRPRDAEADPEAEN